MALDSPITCNPLYTGGCLQGEWCQWERWDSCSTTCGTGKEEWGRQCNCPAPGPGGMNCPGFHTKIEECHNQRCPGINGGWLCLQGVNKCPINFPGLELTYNSILFESILKSLTNLFWNLISYPIEVSRSWFENNGARASVSQSRKCLVSLALGVVQFPLMLSSN